MIDAEKDIDKDGKTLYKLMINAIYCKTMERFTNRIDVKLESKEKDYMKWTSKPSSCLKKYLIMIKP